jgi:nicotinamide mononucleotide adenylyltransferase
MDFKRFLKEDEQLQKPVIIVMTGSFSPIHQGHIGSFDVAKQYLESQGHQVVGGYMSPKHDGYVKSKGASTWIPIQDRVKMMEMMLPQWIRPHTWESKQPTPRSRFAVLDQVKQEHPEAEIAFLCGEDSCFHGTPETIPGMMRVQGYLYVVVPRSGGISSTKVRNAIKSGQSTGGFLSPEVEEYLRNYYSQQ